MDLFKSLNRPGRGVGESRFLGRPAPGADQIKKPPVYEHPRAFLELLDSGGWIGFPLLAIPWLLWWLTGLAFGVIMVSFLITYSIGLLAVYRGIRAMNGGWISADPDTGLCTVHEGGVVWLGMSKSSAQNHTLTNAPIDTPKRRLRQRILFLTCDDLVLNGVRYRNVKNVGKLKAIRTYRQSVITRGQDLVAPTYDVMCEILAVVRQIAEVLQGPAIRQWRIEDTQPIPLSSGPAAETDVSEVDLRSFRDDFGLDK